MGIDLPTDPVVRDFFFEIATDSGPPAEVNNFILHKTALPIPITTACSMFTEKKVNVRRGPVS